MGSESTEDIATGLLGLTRSEWGETAIVAGLALGAIVMAIVVAFVATRIVHYFTRSSESQLDDQISEAIRRPFIAFVAVAGVASALQTLSYLEDEGEWVPAIARALLVIIVAVAVRRVLLIVVTWQALRAGMGAGRLHPGT